MDFSEWITKKYLAYRGDAVGNDRSISEFAKILHVPQPLLSKWMKHKDPQVPRSQKYINALFKVYGKEVLDVLGIEEPETQFQGISFLPPAMRERLLAAVDETNRRMTAAGFTGASPEAEHLIKETFEKYGFTYTETKTDDASEAKPGSKK